MQLPALLDQRHMSGPTIWSTTEDIEAFWQHHGDDRVAHGLARFPTAPQRREFAHSKKTLKAYVSDGRWCAQCISEGCNGGIACWPAHEKGCCLDCGTIYPIKFPTSQLIEQASNVLAARPKENRNWLPETETVAVLKTENITRGVPLGIS